MKALQRVAQSRTVALLADILSDFDNMVRSDPDHAFVKRPMVDSAHGKTVRNNGFASIRVFPYVCRVQQLRVLKSAEGASGPVREKDPFAKHSLM